MNRFKSELSLVSEMLVQLQSLNSSRACAATHCAKINSNKTPTPSSSTEVAAGDGPDMQRNETEWKNFSLGFGLKMILWTREVVLQIFNG